MEVARNTHILFNSDSEDSDGPPVIDPEPAPAVPVPGSSSDTDPYDVNQLCDNAGVARPKLIRSYPARQSQWKVEKRKSARLQGKRFVGKVGLVDKRRFGPGCLNNYCQVIGNQCRAVSDREREAIFLHFWNLPDWNARALLIKACTDVASVGPRRTKNTWHLKLMGGRRFIVCRKLVESTLGLSGRTLTSWLQRKKTEGPRNTSAPKTGPTAPVDGEDDAFLENWIKSVPTVPSHYCRQLPTYRERRFFEPGTTQAQLHRSYKEAAAAADRRILSITTFSSKLKALKYSVFVPKKDQCDECVKRKTNAITQEEYRTHRRAVDVAKVERQTDEREAKTDPTTAVFTMDLQAILLCPKTEAAAMFYRTKLHVRNMVFYNKKTHDAKCYVFDETEGNLSSDTFAYFHRRFLSETLVKPAYNQVTEAIIWSDGCGYQNRNAVCSSSFLHMAMARNITITQKYLVKGHTMMECDSIHATIERRLKNRDVYTPDDIEQAARDARVNPGPYDVVRIFHGDFLKLDSPHLESIRPGHAVGDHTVHDLRAIQYRPNGQVLFKLKFQDEWQVLPQPVNFTRKTTIPSLLGRLPITRRKFIDLQALKDVIPEEHRRFYDDLPQ